MGSINLPELYGAFPTDPYSHTPGNKGAQQPGMTGQVKEDVLNRWAELGVSVSDGCVLFNPALLDKNELLTSDRSFEYMDLAGETQKLDLSKGQLAYTYCQVPVIYNNHEIDSIIVDYADGSSEGYNSLNMEKDSSKKLFARTGEIASITVNSSLFVRG